MASHVASRAALDLVLVAGVYVRVASMGTGSSKVYSDPVGPISIFAEHQADILAVADTEPGMWTCRFNTWEMSLSAAAASTIFEMKARAKDLQTPKRINPSARADFSTIFQDMNPVSIEDSVLQTNLSLYEDSWQEALRSVNGDKQEISPEDWTLGKHLWETHEYLCGVTKVISRLAEDQISDRQWSEYEMHSSTLRITDLEKLVGDPTRSGAASVWTSISTLSSTLTATESRLNAQLAVKYAALELKMDQMLDSLKLFRESLNLKSEAAVKRISSLELAAASAQAVGPSAPVDLDLILKGLGMDRDAVKHRVDSLEARMETNQAKIEIAGSQSRPRSVLHSSVDLRGYLAGINGSGGSLSFGGFADVYTFLARIEARQKNSTLEQMVKTQKDVKTLGLLRLASFWS